MSKNHVNSWPSVRILRALVLIQTVSCVLLTLITGISTGSNSSSNDVNPPIYPAYTGEDFGHGTIDLGGGLGVTRMNSSLLKVWGTERGGSDGVGVSCFEPTSILPDFYLIGHYCKVNDVPRFESLLIATDTSGDGSHGSLKSPVDYTLTWTSQGFNLGQRVEGYIWLPIPPEGYKAIGQIVTTSSEKPPLDMVRCVRADLTDLTELDQTIWTSSGVNLFTTRPINSRLSVPADTFLARQGSDHHELACLKMTRTDPYHAMPSMLQILTMIEAYAPFVYFHPDEEFFPSSVLWAFESGVQLFQSGKDPVPIINDGDNLPSNTSLDDTYLDLPREEAEKDLVKSGYLPTATPYLHVKPSLGGTFTDIVIWIYYPFNGGSKFQFGPFTINLGRIGEHVGDWEHITLRIDNYHGVLKNVYLSQHAKGKWITPREFELVNDRKPVVYASLHGHAHFHLPQNSLHSEVDIGSLDKELKVYINKSAIVTGEKLTGVGVRNDVAKGEKMMDVSVMSDIVCVDHFPEFSVGSPWLNFAGRWGPKITFEYADDIRNGVKDLPEAIKGLVLKIMKKLPAELFGEEGPEGPKMKDSWTGEERV